MANDKIPFLDLVAPHEELKEELCAVFANALKTAGFIGGPMVEGFERDFAAFCETKHCVGLASGTDAVRFGLMAAGIGQGDVVVTVPNTFIATAEAISQTGARPVFVDVDEQTYNMDPTKLEEFLEFQCEPNVNGSKLIHQQSGLRVAAVVPVHLYGQVADMDAIQELTERYGLILIEDACQAHGAEYFSQKSKRWRRAGSIGRAAAFSFYPGKNLGACGEAGAITTGDAELAAKVRMLRDHGQAKKYYHDVEGYNGRLDSIQAGILQIKLRHLSSWNERRRAAAQRYREMLGTASLDLVPFESGNSRSVYHLYVVRLWQREAVMKYLAELGIGTAIHYPVPLHLQVAYHHLGYKKGAFPVAEALASEILSLPMFPQLTEAQQKRVIDAIAAYAVQHEILPPERAKLAVSL